MIEIGPHLTDAIETLWIVGAMVAAYYLWLRNRVKP